ncbi:MAG: outer membrane lipoprotein carrier protein LolA [Gemmatimonadota bacterium]
MPREPGAAARPAEGETRGAEGPENAGEGADGTGETGGARDVGSGSGAVGAAPPPAPSPVDTLLQELPPDVEELLARAERTYDGLSSLRARFHQTIDVPLLDRHREGSGLWYQKGRGHFRMDFQDPPDDEIVADGRFLWLYYPSTNPKQVIRSTLTEGSTRAGTADLLARILAEARSGYRGRYEGRQELAGVQTHLIRLRPLGRSPYREVAVWIGVPDDLVRRFRITEENETVRSVTLSGLEPNVSLPDSLFRFTPPPDADVFEG